MQNLQQYILVQRPYIFVVQPTNEAFFRWSRKKNDQQKNGY